MFGYLRNLFIPHRTNNHRAKILHNSSLISIVFLFLFASITIHFIGVSHPDVLGVSYSISEGDLLNLVNSDRQANSLSPLTENSQLDDAARRKAADMFAKNYWAHFAPDGSTSPWMFIKDAGYTYTYAGENLAKGFTDAPSVETAWMNSPTHRENLLSGNFKDVGYAIVPGSLSGEDTVLVVQMFGSRNTDTAAISPEAEVSQSPQVKVVPSLTPISAKVASAEITPIPTVAVVKAAVSIKPLIDTKSTTRTISTAGLALIIIVLVVDLIIVEKKKIPRLVGHNIDHILIISLFLIFVILATSGVTL